MLPEALRTILPPRCDEDDEDGMIRDDASGAALPQGYAEGEDRFSRYQ
jgi:hypothetical protein